MTPTNYTTLFFHTATRNDQSPQTQLITVAVVKRHVVIQHQQLLRKHLPMRP